MEEKISRAYNTSTVNGKTEVTISETKPDKSTKRACFKEVENGWVIDVTKEYYEGEGEKREWKYENKTYISKENPLEMSKKKKKSEEEKQKEDMNAILGGVSDLMGSMFV